MTHTHRLYWEDPYLTRFEARIVEATEHQGRPAAVLDATAFYPTSGGQPHDTGRLGDAFVVEVVEEGERIVHVLDRELPPGPTAGEVDWQRRFDHMQQHSGQHILSAACERVLDANTVSFHLGAETATIDLDVAELDPPRAARVENAANRVVFEDRAFLVGEYAPEDLAELPLRRPPAVEGSVRVVQVRDFDASACGGTHVRSAGEIGLIHIRRWERSRSQVRVEFLCGWRALQALRERNAIVQTLAGSLSVGASEVLEAVERVVEAERAARHELEGLRRELLDHRAEDLVRRAEPRAVRVVVRAVLEGTDAAGMRYLAQKLVQHEGLVALLAVAEPSPQVVFARSSDVNADMGALLRDVLGRYGGRGGGRPHLAQGGGVDEGDLAAVLAEAERELG